MTIYMTMRALFQKITFTSPKKSDVLIFDAEGSDFLLKHVIYEMDHTILPVRGEKYHLTPAIIIQFLLIYVKAFYCKVISRGALRKIGLFRAYALACVQYIKPKVVMTIIDNNPTFYWLANQYTAAEFFAIQNGARSVNHSIDCTTYDIDRLLLGFMGEDGKRVLYFCFGDFDASFYKKYGAPIKTFYPVGSLKGSYYRYSMIQELPRTEYDICFVSQYRNNIMNGAGYPEFKDSLQILEDFILQFIQETGARVCIALASADEEEYNYYFTKFGNHVTIKRNIKNLFTTYEAMSKSEVILSFNSTAAIEAFGWGKKVLLCNYSGDPIWGYTFSEICTTDTVNYHCFKDKLQSLLDMDAERYISATRDAQKNMMNYDSELPASEYIRNLILEHIRNKDVRSDS